MQTEQAHAVVDLSDEQLRARGGIKWTYAGPEVLPAWVAETDLGIAPVVTDAVREAVDRGDFGYPPLDRHTALPEALAAYAERHWAWPVDPAHVVLVGDVMAGVLLALKTLCDNGPVIVPTPTYPPFLDVVPLAGRELVTVPLDPDTPFATLDLDRIDAELAAGARTVLLCNPHNPWGRAFHRAELEGLRDVVTRYGARVVSDDIHAPLVLPGATHVPYASLEGTAEHATTVLSASKAWNVPGLKCAQLVTGTPADAARLHAIPHVANHGVSTLGIAANLAAYRDGQPWLDAFVARLDANRELFAKLARRELPGARHRRLEATYLAWLDVRAFGLEDPARAALKQGRVLVNDGRTFGPGGQGHVRVNLATSSERLERVVHRLAAGLTSAPR